MPPPHSAGNRSSSTSARWLDPRRPRVQPIRRRLMMKFMLPAVLSFALASAGAQEPTPEPSEPAFEELSQILLQQKEIIEAQAKELEELRKRLSEVEALALSSHNRLQELEQKPAETRGP